MSEEKHAHNWVAIGGCTHPHSTGSNGGTAYRCESCGRYGHRIVTFACRGPRRAQVPPSICPMLDFDAWETWWIAEGEPAADARAAKIAQLRADGEIPPLPVVAP